MPQERAVVTSGAITVGVRPEKLRLLSDEPARDGLENVLGPGRIVDVSFAGASTQYILEIPGLGEMTVFEQNMVFGSVVHRRARRSGSPGDASTPSGWMPTGTGRRPRRRRAAMSPTSSVPTERGRLSGHLGAVPAGTAGSAANPSAARRS